MLCACIDIGSNTTRVLVAEVRDGRLTELAARRAFTRLGVELRAGGALSPAKVAEVAAVVAEQQEIARRCGAGAVRAVATAAIRSAANRDELVDAIHDRCGLRVSVLDGVEEARLAFLGATRTLPRPPAGVVGVVDVGGGSTEIAVGSVRDGVTWSASFLIGSGSLAERHLGADPPSAPDIERVRSDAAAVLENLHVPPVELGIAVGGSAASLRRLVGGVIDRAAVGRALDLLCRAPAAAVAAELSLDEQRVRLLPAGLVLLSECAGLLGGALEVGLGGLREGVCLELADVT